MDNSIFVTTDINRPVYMRLWWPSAIHCCKQQNVTEQSMLSTMCDAGPKTLQISNSSHPATVQEKTKKFSPKHHDFICSFMQLLNIRCKFAQSYFDPNFFYFPCLQNSFLCLFYVVGT